MEKTDILKEWRGGRVEKTCLREAPPAKALCGVQALWRRQGGNLQPFGFRWTKSMKTFDFTQGTISHNLKDPHSKALEPDRLSASLTVTTQSPRGEGGGDVILNRVTRGHGERETGRSLKSPRPAVKLSPCHSY